MMRNVAIFFWATLLAMMQNRVAELFTSSRDRVKAKQQHLGNSCYKTIYSSINYSRGLYLLPRTYFCSIGDENLEWGLPSPIGGFASTRLPPASNFCLPQLQPEEKCEEKMFNDFENQDDSRHYCSTKTRLKGSKK